MTRVSSSVRATNPRNATGSVGRLERHVARSGMRYGFRLPLLTFVTTLVFLTTSGRAEETSPLVIDLTRLPHKPGEVTDKSDNKVPAGSVELVAGQFGQACKFSFVESAAAQFFTASVNPQENWNEYAGFSFWVKGDGSTSCGGLEFIDGDDYRLRYGYCFPINSTEWVKIDVPWSDLIPELDGPLVDAAGGYAPNRFRNVWVGKWFYWHDYPACSFAIERMQLEKKIDRANEDIPQQPGLPKLLAKLQAGKPVTVVTMGDSLSDKRHWANREALWSEILVQKLHDTFGSEVALVNPAVGGTTLSQNAVRIPTWIQEAPSPDLVIIWFGGNDWDSGVRRKQYEEYLQLTIDRVRHLTRGSAEILVMTTCPGFQRWDTTSELCQAALQVAKQRNTGFVDAAQAFHNAGTREEALQRKYWAWDNVHLGAGGHKLIADLVFHAIESQGLADLKPAELSVLERYGKRDARVHDPSSIVKYKDQYWLFATGTGLQSWHSKDLTDWERGPRVFEEFPAWHKEVVPTQRGHLWAPDIVWHHDRYWLYYSVSSFGKNTSAIGLASNPTLDPEDPKYAWRDHGIVIRSGRTDDFNAIDPAVVQAEDGKLWMSFGSFWSGIKLLELDPATGLRKASESPLRAVAFSKDIEAPHIVAHGDYYYLFVNWGVCCRGVRSTYNVRVGRSRSVTGPYVDKEGHDLLQGGGSLFLESEGPFIGPGHANVMQEDGKSWFSCHYYDRTQRGRSYLALMPLTWSPDGWPSVAPRRGSGS